MEPTRVLWLRLPVVVLGMTLPVFVGAAPDDEEPPREPAVQNEFFVAAENFDQWVFQGAGTLQAGKQQVHSRLKLKLDELDRICGLTPAQKEKLQLAARGDMKRFFEQVEVVRVKFLAVQNDQNAFGQIWQEIQPLQTKLSSGLFNETSLFFKTIRSTLDAEQVAKYDAVLEERRKFRYKATIEISLTTLEKTVALRSEQHKALAKLLIEETPPPYAFGQYDHYLVMYQLAKLPEAKVKSLVEDHQWAGLKQQLDQHRGMEQWLIQNGVLAKAAEPARERVKRGHPEVVPQPVEE